VVGHEDAMEVLVSPVPPTISRVGASISENSCSTIESFQFDLQIQNGKRGWGNISESLYIYINMFLY